MDVEVLMMNLTNINTVISDKASIGCLHILYHLQLAVPQVADMSLELIGLDHILVLGPWQMNGCVHVCPLVQPLRQQYADLITSLPPFPLSLSALLLNA